MCLHGEVRLARHYGDRVCGYVVDQDGTHTCAYPQVTMGDHNGCDMEVTWDGQTVFEMIS